jgi:hypothetical protein
MGRNVLTVSANGTVKIGRNMWVSVEYMIDVP